MASQNIFDQIDAIFALEGLHPNEDVLAFRKALLDGKVSYDQAIGELKEYVFKNQTVKGFIESRDWL